MTEKRQFFAELLHRRVPQYLGLYIAGVWMAIEIGDWLIEQFALPERLTAYIFVSLAVMLPSIALFAWTHGAPGKDEASRFEKIFVPINLVVAALAIFVLPDRPGSVASGSTALAQVETPAAAAEVRNSSQRMMAFFLRNNTESAPDWLAYGISFLIGEDISRASPRLGMYTPFSSSYALEQLRRAGFANGVDEPLTVQMKIARESQFNFFLRGELRDAAEGGGLKLVYALHEPETGRVVTSGEADLVVDSLLDTVDAVSAELQAFLVQQFDEPPRLSDLPVAEVVSPSIEALQLYVDAKIAEDILQDYPRHGALLDEAIAADLQFAEAHAARGIYAYLVGDSDTATAALDKALEYDYRLSTESKFTVRINRQAVANNYAEAIRIAELWTEVEPNNERSFMTLANLISRLSNDADKALQALDAVRKINPAASNTLLSSANLELQRNNFDEAEALVEEYIEQRADSAQGFMTLARVQVAGGDLETAIESFQRAGYLDSNSLEPALGIIGILLRKGEFAQAEDQLATLRQRELTDQQRLRVLTTGIQLYALSGRYSEAARWMRAEDDAVRRVMPPLIAVLQVDAPVVMMEAMAGGDPEKSLAELAALRAQMQPPWTSMLHLFDLSIHDITSNGEGYVEAFARAEEFLNTQSDNENLKMMLYSGKAHVALIENDLPATAENARLAIESTENSLMKAELSSEVFVLRAQMYNLLLEAGEAKESIAGLTQIIEAFPGLALAHLYLAQAYYETGKTALARSALQRAEDIWSNADPGFVYLNKVAQLREALRGDA